MHRTASYSRLMSPNKDETGLEMLAGLCTREKCDLVVVLSLEMSRDIRDASRDDLLSRDISSKILSRDRISKISRDFRDDFAQKEEKSI